MSDKTRIVVQFRLDEQLRRLLDEEVARTGENLSVTIRMLLRDALAERRERDGNA